MSKARVKKVKDGANAVYHGAKGLEQATSIKATDARVTKVKKFANAIKHIAKGLEKALR